MNLGQIKTRVQNALQFFSDNAEHQLDIENTVNDQYIALMDAEQWPFRVVESSLRLFADRENEAGSDISIDADGLISNQNEWFTQDFDALVVLASDESGSRRRYGRIAGPFPRNWQQVVNRSKDDYSYDQGAFPATSESSGVINAYVDHPPAATFTNAAAGTVLLRHDRYQLPYDCSEIIAIHARDDRQGMIPLENRNAEAGRLSSNDDGAGTPQCWVRDDDVDAGEAPLLTPTATASVGGSLAATSTYRYFYAYWYRGCYSGRSEIVTGTTTGVNKTITVANMEVSHVDQYGRYKHLFREDTDTRPGRFYYLASVADEDAQYVDTGGTTPDRLYPWDDRMASPHKCVRFWPRPAADQWVSVQYLSMPRRLNTDQDVPAFPEQFHRILVHRTIAEYAQRAGNAERRDSELALANEIYKRMLQKEINTYERRTRLTWSPRGARPPVGRSTITFTG